MVDVNSKSFGTFDLLKANGGLYENAQITVPYYRPTRINAC